MAPHALTVLGPVSGGELGVTLIHEHLHMDATQLLAVHGYRTSAAGRFDLAAAAEARWNPGSHPDNYRFTEDRLVIEELRRYRRAGGRTIVDLTPPALGRDPLALRAIAQATGVNVIMGTGHYLSPTHDPRVASSTEDELAAEMVAEWRDGVGDSGIRPGIIGELGTSVPIHAEEVRVLRAAARAAVETGLAVSIHLHPWGRTGAEVLAVLLGENVDPARVILGHMTTAHDDEAYLQALLDTGVYVAFDLFGFDHSLLGTGRWPPSDADVATTVARLVRSGHAQRLLLSQDIGVRTRLRRYGSWGYAHLLEHVVPLLVQRGLSEAELNQLLVLNPRSLLMPAGTN